MIRRYLEALRYALMAVDAMTAALLFGFLALAYYGQEDWPTLWLALGVDLWLSASLFGIAWVAALWYHRLYDLRVRWAVRTEATDIVRATFLVATATLSFLFLVNRPGVSRLFLIVLFLAAPVATIVSRVVLRSVFGAIRARGRDALYMLVVGTNADAQAFADRVEDHRALGIRVIGHLAAPGAPEPMVSRSVVGSVEDLDVVLHTRAVDEVAICLGDGDRAVIERVKWLCAAEGKVVRIPHTPSEPVAERRVEDFDGMLVESIVTLRHRITSLWLKRALDITLAAAALVAFAPIMAIVALAIWRTDGRPILFRQVRIGRHGRPFAMYKFRTMVRDAEAKLNEVRALSAIQGPALQLDRDPRVTSIGRWLRATSLDELPQLWNVLMGDMSIVGPRPAPPVEVDEYDVWHRRRLSMKPGITGLAQVVIRSYRNFDDRARLDLRYIDEWSLALDAKLLVRTVGVVLRASGR